MILKPVMPWIRAARPKTLPAAAVPVFIGGALASAGGFFAPTPWLLCLGFALLIQIGTNYANDYYDFLRGADDHRRIGPRRAVASGWIRPEVMRRGMVLTFVLAVLTGSFLIPYGGWWLLLVGLLSVVCGIAYTGGPYPLGYNGWGDVFVFVFFGWVATGLTYYVQAGTFVLSLAGGASSAWVWIAGVLPGALSTNLLVVNNVRDQPLDREAGKRTLAVRLGRRFAEAEFAFLNGLALAAALLFALPGGARGTFLVLILLPWMIRLSAKLKSARAPATFQAILAQTALVLLLAGLLFSAGLLVS
jgi:1,4-dihydroxy-2-naphthoate octaprenyltransferase